MKTRLYVFVAALFSLTLFSCLNNDDEGKGDEKVVGEKKERITKEGLQGDWELYYHMKEITEGLQSKLRFTETDGFKVRFDGDKFIEYNGYGDITQQGTYSIKLDPSDKQLDSLKFHFKDKVTLKDTTTGDFIPAFSNFRLNQTTRYYGTATNGDGKVAVNIQDTRMYRNLQRAPDIHPEIKKVDLPINYLLGKWVLSNFTRYVNGELQIEAEDWKSGKGTVIEFKKEGNEYLFKEILKNGTLAHNGTFKVTDDVINLFYKTKDQHGIDSTANMKLWIHEKLKSKGKDVMIDSDEWRADAEVTKLIVTRLRLEKL